MSKLVHIIRHGQTDFNRAGIVQGSGVDAPLNDYGRSQARAFYEAYRDFGYELVITSSLIRSQQSVAGFIEDGIPHLIMPEINEMNWGSHEGKKSTPAMIAEYQHVKDGWALGRIDARIGGGESARELGARLEEFLEQLRKRSESPILVCSHGRAMCGLVSLMKGYAIDRMNEFRHANLGLWIARQDGDTYHFEQQNDLSHLESLEQPSA